MKPFRVLHKAYANANGFFWLPCALCGYETGGHEDHDSSIHHNGTATSTGVCNSCSEKADKWNSHFGWDYESNHHVLRESSAHLAPKFEEALKEYKEMIDDYGRGMGCRKVTPILDIPAFKVLFI